MGVLSWALSRRANATADPTIPAQDGASARSYMEMLRGVMTAARALADDQGGAIVTSGLLPNVYTAFTASGVKELRAGLSFLLKIDRVNTGAATLNVDGTGPKPWRDVDGKEFDGGMLPTGRFLRATFDADRDAWISDVLVVDEQYQNPLAYTFPTRAAAQAATIPLTANSLVLRGLGAVGDGLGATYKRVSAATSDASFTSADGGIWQRAELAVLRDLYINDCAGFTDHDKLVAGNAAALASGRRLCITRPVKVSADITFACDLVFAPGGRLIKDPAQVSTLNVAISGGLSAGARQIFDRALAIYLGIARCEVALYEWWGAVGSKNPTLGSDMPDSASAINACWASGHNWCRGAMRSYRHTDTLYARNSKTHYGPAAGELPCEMWFDDPSGIKTGIVVQAVVGQIYNATLGEHLYIRMQRATAGSAIYMADAIQPRIYGWVFAPSAADPRWYFGITIGGGCLAVDMRGIREVSACVSAGIKYNVPDPAKKVTDFYLPQGPIRDSPINVDLYGYFEGVFSYDDTLNFNGTSACWALGSPVKGGGSVVKLQKGDTDTGVAGYYCTNISSIGIDQWVSNFTKCGTFIDCEGLSFEAAHLYPNGASAEGIELQGCSGSVYVKVAGSGQYAVRTRASTITGKGNNLTVNIDYAANQSYGILDNSLPPGTGASVRLEYCGYRNAASVTTAAGNGVTIGSQINISGS